jgi:hypothetical protein
MGVDVCVGVCVAVRVNVAVGVSVGGVKEDVEQPRGNTLRRIRM